MFRIFSLENMKLQLVVAFVLVLVAVQALPAKEAKGSKVKKPEKEASESTKGKSGISKHIVSGTAATLGQWPWQVYILITKPTGYSYCGGSLIHVNWVVTAAHCTQGGTSFSVRLGSLSQNTGGTTQTTTLAYTHYLYNTTSMLNDIALIKLPTAVTLSTTIKTIPIVPASTTVFSPLVVSGWGKVNDTSSGSPTLQWAPVVNLNNTACKARFGPYITDNNICTVGSKTNESPCNGDSGGPLVLNSATKYLVGAVSFGSQYCTKNYPAVYTRVANYRPWMLNITKIAF